MVGPPGYFSQTVTLREGTTDRGQYGKISTSYPPTLPDLMIINQNYLIQ